MSVPALDAAETRRAMDAARGVLRMLQNAPPKGKLNQYKAALSDLKDAVIETRRYQNKKVRDGDEEDKLSTLWFGAANKIADFNVEVANLCRVKGWGWADENTWDLPENRDLPIRLEQMVSQYQSVMKQVNTYEDALREAQDLAQQLAAANKTAAAATMLRHNAWVNGSFYLVAMLSVLALLAAISTVVKLVLLPVLIIGGILAVTVIGALQLRNDDQLSQENFISLMGLTFRELPLVRIWYRRPRPPG